MSAFKSGVADTMEVTSDGITEVAFKPDGTANTGFSNPAAQELFQAAQAVAFSFFPSL